MLKHYFATVLPGLEGILQEEIKAKLPKAQIVKKTRGKVFFKTNQSYETFQVLKTAHNLYQFIHSFTVGRYRKDLHTLEKEAYQLDLRAYLKKGSFYVNASRRGTHTYSRFEAAQKVMEGILKRNPHRNKGTAKNHDVEFRLDIDHQQAIFSYRLTDATFRYRGRKRHFTAASLTPPVAHALVWASHPQEGDVFIDPCCGSGTILAERLHYPFTYIGGGDIDLNAVSAAKNNLKEMPVEVNQWNAKQLNFKDDSIPKVVTNLPFGKQISSQKAVEKTNQAIVEEIYRILMPQGKAVILSNGWDLLQKAEAIGFTLERKFDLSLKGLHPTLYVFHK